MFPRLFVCKSLKKSLYVKETDICMHPGLPWIVPVYAYHPGEV